MCVARSFDIAGLCLLYSAPTQRFDHTDRVDYFRSTRPTWENVLFLKTQVEEQICIFEYFFVFISLTAVL